MCFPFCQIDNEEFSFHIDSIDSEKYTSSQSKWRVCSITHQMMQRNPQGDVTIDQNCTLLIKPDKNHEWLIDLTCDVMEFGNKNNVINDSMLRSIGLDKKEFGFFGFFVFYKSLPGSK